MRNAISWSHSPRKQSVAANKPPAGVNLLYLLPFVVGRSMVCFQSFRGRNARSFPMGVPVMRISAKTRLRLDILASIYEGIEANHRLAG
jgi:hypothetical protein